MRVILQYIFPIIAIAASIIEAYIDANNKRTISHLVSALVRLSVSVLISFYMFGYNKQYYYMIIYTIMLLNIYWIVFDPMYNYFKGVTTIWYIGKTDKIDIIARKIFSNQGGRYLAIKVLLLIALFIGYVYND